MSAAWSSAICERLSWVFNNTIGLGPHPEAELLRVVRPALQLHPHSFSMGDVPQRLAALRKEDPLVSDRRTPGPTRPSDLQTNHDSVDVPGCVVIGVARPAAVRVLAHAHLLGLPAAGRGEAARRAAPGGARGGQTAGRQSEERDGSPSNTANPRYPAEEEWGNDHSDMRSAGALHGLRSEGQQGVASGPHNAVAALGDLVPGTGQIAQRLGHDEAGLVGHLLQECHVGVECS